MWRRNAAFFMRCFAARSVIIINSSLFNGTPILWLRLSASLRRGLPPLPRSSPSSLFLFLLFMLIVLEYALPEGATGGFGFTATLLAVAVLSIYAQLAVTV